MSDTSAVTPARPHPDTGLYRILPRELCEVAARLRALMRRSGVDSGWARERLAAVRDMARGQQDPADKRYATLLQELAGSEEPAPASPARERQSLAERLSGAVKRAVEPVASVFRAPEQPDDPPVRPSAQAGLLGLAFSGGGIRSATFNLGVLQVLARIGALERVDYLSTVSGGGYIGSCLSALLARSDVGMTGAGFPFHHRTGQTESEAMRKLRRGGNYVAPAGLVDLIRIPVLVLRGMVMNLLAIAPALLLAVWLTERWAGEPLRIAAAVSPLEVWPWFYAATPWVAAAFAAYLLAFPVVSTLDRSFGLGARIRRGWSTRNTYERSFAILAIIAVLTAAVESAPGLVHLYQYAHAVGFWSDRIAPALIGAIPVAVSLLAGGALQRARENGGRRFFYLVGLLGPLLVVLLYVVAADAVLFHGPGQAAAPWLPGIAALVFVFVGLFGDANASSLHEFYRDRLSRAYLFRVGAAGDVLEEDVIDTLKLSDLAPEGRPAPYHLLNAAVNLEQADDQSLRGREADFFIFSKHWTGSERTGYGNTRILERMDPRLDLGTAMAVSGAAVAPLRGVDTSKSLAFLLALLNLRLGRWLRNPRAAEDPPWRRVVSRPGQYWYFKEFLAKRRPDDFFVNVSDGGHIENLGIYQLLRRRCRCIIACDAEQDVDLHFTSLARAIRYARIDMGIHVDFPQRDLERIRAGKRHWALGRVDYGPRDGADPGAAAEQGVIVYLKASICGNENPYVLEYRARNPTFPHESTSDQFFNEEQFEAYRALGWHIADDAEQLLRRLHVV